jgi:octaprenyl-diphosphate synthase
MGRNVVTTDRAPHASVQPEGEVVRAVTAQFAAELAAVEDELVAALADLNPPFSQLVQRQLKRIYPLLRAGVVLATATGAPGDELLRARRIDLAAAVEMLYLALCIHTRLLGAPTGSGDLDRSLLGSTILAGDYCFSRAAGLAVRTDSPAVVDIFARALKRASEGHLRQLLEPEAEDFDENGELLISGVMAGCELASLAPENRAANLRQGEGLARWLQAKGDGGAQPVVEVPADELQAEQTVRWQQVYRLLRTA